MKSVTIEELREKLDEVIDEVEKGETLSITRNGNAVILMKPGLMISPPRVPGRLQDIELGPPPMNLRSDAAQLITDEREHERSEKKWRS
jgi:antitoxin (DNA-binding transcriptional repressor) of toxin-antitoxin stability system